jgi:hypothetical protein
MSEGVSDVDTAGGPAGPPFRVGVDWSESLRMRGAGQDTMRDCLSARNTTPRSPRLSRFLGVHPLVPAARVLYRRALTQRAVAGLLEELGVRWDILHGVPCPQGGPQLDHLVIGPAGVFVIRGYDFRAADVWVSEDGLRTGRRKHPLGELIGQAASAAQWLETATGLQPAARAVAVVLEPAKIWTKRDSDAVAVVGGKALVTWLLTQPQTLSGTEVAMLSDAADRPATWDTAGSGLGAEIDLRARFDALRTEVESAARRRRVWGISGVVAAAAAAWAGAFGIVLIQIS